jgi:hypothetical protein
LAILPKLMTRESQSWDGGQIWVAGWLRHHQR